MRSAVAWWWVLHVAAAGKVLVVFPGESAHGDALVKAILDAGHQVTYVRAQSALPAHTALFAVDISSPKEDHDEDRIALLDLVRSTPSPERALRAGEAAAEAALRHGSMQPLLTDPALAFDLVVAQWDYTRLLAPLASLFSCPLVWYSSGDVSWLSEQLVDAPSSAAYSAEPLARRAPGSAFRDRLDRLRRQAYLAAWTFYMTYYVEAPIYDEIYRTPMQIRGRYAPHYEELVWNASLLLVNSHPLLGQALALPQNAKYIGGYHIKVPTPPLAKNVQKLLDSSRSGLIFFSLGPNVRSEDLTDYMKQQLLDVFGQLQQTVLWEIEEPLRTTHPNVHVVKKAPRAGVLNHPNTVMMISHGESFSIIEGLYYGKPIIAIPVKDDQFLSLDLLAARGLGVRVGLTEYAAHKIKDAIKTILSNSSYATNTQKVSTLLQKPLVSPQKELLYWLELAMSGGVDHLRSPALRLSAFERLHLDVVAVVAMCAWFLTKILKVIRVHWNSDVTGDKKNQ